MEKMKRWILLAAIVEAAVAVLVIVLLIVTLSKVNDMYDMLYSGAVTYQSPVTVEQEESEEKLQPEILKDSSFEFQGEDTISEKAGTIGCKVSITPYEFKKDTKARVKYDGKSYDLERKGNSFTGILPVSMYETPTAEVILEDGDTVRSADVYGDDEMNGPLVPTDASWNCLVAGNGVDPQEKDGQIKFNLKGSYCLGEFADERPHSAKIAVFTGAEQIYEKAVALEGDVDDLRFQWQDTVKVPKNTEVAVYMVNTDSKGFIYRYLLGKVKGDQDFFKDPQTLQVLSPSGKVLLTKETGTIN